MRPWPAISSAIVTCLALSQTSVSAIDSAKGAILQSIEYNRPAYETLARHLWDLAELGYQETEGSALLQQQAAAAGFTVRRGVADIPTAFVASYGQGSPVIGILAEFDALPGLSQAIATERQPVVEGGSGHACGHHLFGAASTAAAIAIREWLAASGESGTIRLYGTPAEEGGSGKVYMARAGLFDDLDVVLHWHPDDRNFAGPYSTNANRSARFRFRGRAAHAAKHPDRGRSALDGVEAMNHMVNLLREHVPEATRMHYVITSGGEAPNIVPEFAEVYYYVRHPDVATLARIWERVVAAAEGAARGTGTGMDYEVMHGNYNILPNETLARVVDASLRQVGGVTYTEAELRFAQDIWETFEDADFEIGSQSEIQPFRSEALRSSSDVGDVTWLVPTVGLRTATWVPGTAAHSWQAVAAGGMGIGLKGMMVAAKTLALTAQTLYTDPKIIEAARSEWQQLTDGREYSPLLGDRQPPLDYRR